jgi:hypothetical protein
MSTLQASPTLNAAHVATLADQIDRLAEIRAAKRQLEHDERTLTAGVLQTMRALSLPAFRATRAVATVGTRTTLTVDPELFLTAAPRGFAALTVSIEKARLYLGESDLAAISERTTVPTLRVDGLSGGAA